MSAMVICLVWVYLSCFVLLLGALLDNEIGRRQARGPWLKQSPE